MGFWIYVVDNVCDSCHRSDTLGEWNYTHNINYVLHDAARAIGEDGFFEMFRDNGIVRRSKWFNFMSAVDRLCVENAENYKKMEPDNGWGSVKTLRKMLSDITDSLDESDTARVMLGSY